ncbi:hypothetical protein A2U01_0092388, partial [Trifolium medium]|nr:hypothetical protein [Trifolium medium]
SPFNCAAAFVFYSAASLILFTQPPTSLCARDHQCFFFSAMLPCFFCARRALF